MSYYANFKAYNYNLPCKLFSFLARRKTFWIMKKHDNIIKSLLVAFTLSLIFVSGSATAHGKLASSQSTPWTANKDLKQELPAKRNRFSKHFMMNNGEFRMYTSPSSIHYQTANGWQEIDNTVQANNSGVYASHPYYNGSNAFKTYYPTSIQNGQILTTLAEGSISESLEGFYAVNQSGQTVYQYAANAVNATPSDNQLAYVNLFPNTTARYAQQNDGRKFDLILQNNQMLNALPASAKYLVLKEKINIPASWTVSQSENGINIYQGNTWLACLSKPMAFENPNSGKTNLSDNDMMLEGSHSFTRTGNELTIYTKFDLAWLQDPQRAFPVNLDPTVQFYPFAVSMATGRLTLPTATKANGGLRLAGAGGGVSWAKFDISTLPSGAVLSAAIYYGYNYSGTTTPTKLATITGFQTLDPSLATTSNSTIWTYISAPSGPVYSSTCPFSGSVLNTWYSGSLNSQALSDIAAQTAQGWTALAFNYASGGTGTSFQYGWDPTTTTLKNYLELTYSTSGCSTVTAGTAQSSVTLACGDPFTLTLSGNSTGTGTTFQWQSSPPGANTWTNIGTIQTSPFYATSQIVATDYRCIVACSSSTLSDISTTVAVGQNSVINCYCVPTGAPTSSNFIVSFSTTGALTNITNPNNTYTTSPVAGYADYTSMIASATPGSTVNVSVTFTTGSHAVGVWVDWNQDGDFNDAGENPITTGAALTTNPYNASFVVPATALSGNTRMRVRTAAVSGPASACGLNTNGEAEDYTINVLGPCTSAVAASITPASYTICPLTTQVLTATMPVLQLGTSYQWKQSTTSGGPYTDIAGATNLSYTTIALPSGTYYYVMQTTCANCGPCSVLSNEISILSQNVNAPIATNSSQCAPGIPTCSVSSGAGAIGTGNYNWYNAATGGTLLQSKPYGPLVSYYVNDFNTTALGNASVTGNTTVSANTLQLFPNAVSQYGAFQVNQPNATWDKMKADFDFTTSGVPTNMADGFSLSFGNDVVNTAEATMNAENGTGTKVKLAFVAYTNGLSSAGIYLMYNCTTNEQTPSTAGVLAYSPDVSWRNASGHVTFSIDSLGKANVVLGGVTLFSNVQLPAAYLSTTIVNTRPTWRFVFKGRTGAISMGTTIDNLDIKLSTLVTGTPTYLSPITSTTTFYVSELGTNGCLSPRTPVTATVNTPPTISINPIPNDSVCTGAPVTLSAGGASTYLWNGNATTVNGDTTFAQAVAGTYTVTGTDANGCSNTASVLIYLHPVVSGTASASPNTICLGATTNLTATAIPICTGLYVPNFVGYYTPTLWTLTNITSNGTTNFTGAPANMKLSTGTLASQPGGGLTSLSKIITCAGNVSFNWSFNHPLDAYADYPQYSINGVTYAFPTYNTSLYGATQTGTMVIPVNAGDSLSIEVVTIDNDPDAGMLTLTNFSAPGPKINGTISYWDAPTGGNNIGTPPLTVTPGTSGTVTYYAQYTSSTTGCVNVVREPAAVTVHALPTISVSGGGSVCAGSPLPNVNMNLTGTSPWNFSYSGPSGVATISANASSTYTVTNAAVGNYSVLTVSDANCTGTAVAGNVNVSTITLPTATVSGGGSVCVGNTLPDVSIALSGASPWSLSYTDGTTPVTVNGITTSPYTITGALGNYNVLTVNDANCLGTSSGSATVANYPVPSVSGSFTPNTPCYGNTVVPTGSGTSIVSYTWSSGLVDNQPFIATTNYTYTVTGTDANACTATSTVNLAVAPANNILSQSAVGNTMSVTGIANNTNLQADGSNVMYTDASCFLIANVADQPGGNTLGSTTSTVTVEPTVLTYNGQPYTRRWYTITPTNNVNVNANVTIYQTQGDFDDYNAANGVYPDLPTGPNDLAGIANVAVTKVSGGGLGVGVGVIQPMSVVWNAATNYWEITFNVTGTFSEFYIHALNPLGSALPVSLLRFTGKTLGHRDQLEWITSSENNNAGFELQFSTDAIHYETISRLPSKAINGNSQSQLSYQAINANTVAGHNYYRLQQTDIDGHTQWMPTIVDLYHEAEAQTISLYPNPVQDLLHIDLSQTQAATIELQVRDMSGRVIRKVMTNVHSGFNTLQVDVASLSVGMYTLEVKEADRLIFTRKFSK